MRSPSFAAAARTPSATSSASSGASASRSSIAFFISSSRRTRARKRLGSWTSYTWMPWRPTLSEYAGPTPMPVVPSFLRPRSRSSRRSSAMCHGMMRWARSLTRRFAVEIPLRSRSASSRQRSARSTTQPGPSTQSASGLKIPLGTRWSLNVPCWLTTVWPALLPPWNRMTTSASCARRSVILPLPSSPH